MAVGRWRWRASASAVCLHEHVDGRCLERQPEEDPHVQADAKGPQVRRPARVQLGARLVVAAHLGREECGRARGGLDVVLVPSTRLDVGDAEVGELGHLPAEGGGGGMVAVTVVEACLLRGRAAVLAGG